MYDYVIVGAGSAGCVLAGRLSEDPDVRVLLLEAGGPDSDGLIEIPAAFAALLRTDYDWDHSTAPEPGYPPLLDTIVWLLQDPAARENLRRQLIDGTAAAIEPVLYTLAYDGPYEAEGDPVRWITLEQMEQEWAAEGAEKRRRATERKDRNAQ